MVDRNTRRLTANKRGANDANPKASRFDRFAREYIQESTLWPVLIVAVAHAAAFLLPIILFSLRDRKLPAMGAMVVLVALSLRACAGDWRRRHFGPTSGLLLVTWALAAVAAHFANVWRLF